MFLFFENLMQYIWIIFQTLPKFFQISPMSIPTHHFWVWIMHRSVVVIPGVTPLKQDDSPSPSGNPMPIVSPQRVGLHAPLQVPSMLGFCVAWSCASLVPAVTDVVTSCLQKPSHVQMVLFLLLMSTISGPYSLSVASSTVITKPWVKGCDTDIPHRAEYSTGS